MVKRSLSAPFAFALTVMLAGPSQGHDNHVHDSSPIANSGPALLEFEFGGPFSLVDHRGRRRTDEDFRGRHMLIFFGYAMCKSICPVGLGRMAGALDELGEAGERIQPIFITVDPDNDTPDVIAAHVARIHPRMIGLTGTRAELRAAAMAYNVETRLLTEPGGKAPIYAHGSYIFLIKPDGKFAALFPPVMGAQAIAAALRRHVE